MDTIYELFDHEERIVGKVCKASSYNENVVILNMKSECG